VSEPQRRHTGCEMDLVTEPVARLLRGRPVVPQAVRLDDETELRPVEVDAAAMHLGLGQRRRQSGPTGDRPETALEL
jgi:hypothetical protein